MRSGIFAAGVLLGFLLAIGWMAKADTWVQVNGLAKHLSGGEHCNSVTSGLGVEQSHSGADRYSLGFYRNSNCKWSVYAAKAWLPLQFSDLKFGTIGGLVTGYGRPLTPAGGLVATYEPSHYGLNVIFIPPLQGSGNVLWIQGKIRW